MTWNTDELLADPSPSSRAVPSTAMPEKKPECLQSHALNVPWIQILKGKRLVLASASPRRREILAIFVRPHPFIVHVPLSLVRQGLDPEIVPSTFEENLSLSQFEDLHEYPVATANFKAVEVYRRLVVRC